MTTIEVWNKVYSPESGEDIFDYIEQAMREYARIKCLEAIKNTRYAAIEIVCQDEIIDTVHAIHNIPDQDVMPEL